ncbi:CBS domain-containing protein [Pseudoxanthomonas sp. SGNA-20]|jgi:Predicted signal-transduction protein containing cAMP-binding and CBS domains|uniref:Putative signal-transduction protein containing cAMP-binding and CBS domains n=1 Tax=Pseudoxanthomonas taiwanensis J19 TaxID=935569 RepID=A0A562D9P8_9GAMM|nr:MULTISPECIES: CBS domain-containing protein [Pseudoxanthomonas]RRN58724.1 CBS domain-containing protein [Pseudoxanthomonas sp. SGNA-20]TWH06339.1 putative signal-transduction protein containing cAMP-binding and CBS domains [Pseudoxanthomonas taiwanensis J19]
MRTVRQLLAEKPAEVFAVTPDAPVIEAVRLMAEKSIGAVLVMRGDELAGILSERDYARKIVLQGRSSADTPVSAIMTGDVVTVRPDTPVPACMQLVTERRIRHLPVVEQGRVTGVISIGDLVKAVIADQQVELEQLQRYIAG